MSQLFKNVRNFKANVSKFSQFADNLATKAGKIFDFDGVRYRVGTSGNDLAKTTIEIDGVPNTRTTFGEMIDDLYPKVEIVNGTPRVSTKNLETKLRTQLADAGTPPKQIDTIVKSELQQTLSSPAATRLSSMDNAATAVDNAAVASGRSRNLLTETRQLDDAMKAVEVGNGGRMTVGDFQQAMRKWKGTLIPDRIKGTTFQKGGNLSKFLSEANALSSNAPKKTTRRVAELYKPKVVDGGTIVPGIYTRGGNIKVQSGSRALETQASTQASEPELVRVVNNMLTRAKELQTSGRLSQSIVKAIEETRSTMTAAIPDMSTLSEEQRNEVLVDMLEASTILITRLYQADMNGCWLYNKIDGTMKKVKLLTCGHFAEVAEVDTCPTQNYTPGADASIQNCAANLFNPCLQSSTQRTTNTATPRVPNVCSQYLYKGTPIPGAVAGVTTTDACAGVPAEQSCSSYCKSDMFNLPPTMQLLCVDMDFATAYADLMSNFGVTPAEMFSAAALPPAPPKSKTKWIVAGVVAGLVVLGAVGYVYLRRKPPSSTM